VDFLPQGNNFTGPCFIDQILKSLSQEHFAKSADIVLRSLRLHFGNSQCGTAKIMSEEMNRLKCNKVPHLPNSPHLAITDFYLFPLGKQTLHGIEASDEEELKSEILTIFQGISSDDVKKSFDHWIERCEWVAASAENSYPS
jgi:hypothetical protein